MRSDQHSEIYNEKIYDLLDSPLPAPAASTSSTASTGGSSMFSGFLGAKSLFGKFPTVKRSALSLKSGQGGVTNPMGQTVKVVAGMKEIQVHSAEEARAVLAKGQANRRVFSTLANRVSSRSHSIFTIKVHRVPLDPATGRTERTSKFSIVDLAGSERVVNTQTSGERLKEAGNINKSLMVLGQCMEVLRKNQEREKGRKPAIVPFRHSKLTEMFQSFFIGDGKAVMIVNVNPYETGFDENTHVMKFSAVAKGVMTVKKDTGPVIVPVPATPSPEARQKPEPRVVRVSLVPGGDEEEVLYEEEDVEDDDDDEQDEFVNALLDELSTLRSALYESQMAVVLAEANARARTVREYEAKMLEMERKYQERIREEAIEAENKLNAKLDILTRLNAAKTPRRVPVSPSEMTPSTTYDDSDDEVGEAVDGGYDADEGDSGVVEQMLLAGNHQQRNDRNSMSPLAARVKVHLQVAALSPSNRQASPLADEPVRQDARMTQEESGGEGAETEGEAGVGRQVQERKVGDDETSDREDPDEGEQDITGSFVEEDEIVPVALDDGSADDYGEDNYGEDDYGEDEAEEDLPEADDDCFASPRPRAANNQTPVRYGSSHRYAEKENVVPTKDADGPSGDGDDFGFDKSLVIQSGSKPKKTKRKLGGKVKDADDLDAFADGLTSPLANPASSRAFQF
ncbi:hypothetical protein JCM10212_002118 [Sporobolomyces blumeae]